MRNSVVLGLVVIGCVVANNVANALPRGSEVNKPKAFFPPEDYVYDDGYVDDAASERVSCDAILQEVMQFIQTLFGRSVGSISGSNNPNDLIRDVFQGYDVLNNPNTRVSPLKFFKILAKLAKVIPKIVDIIQDQIQGSQSKEPEVVPTTTTTEKVEKRGSRG